jgi:hypothetical protein
LSGATYNPSSRIEAVDQGNFSDNILFQTNNPKAANNGLETAMTVFSTGQVGIGNVTTEPDNQLAVVSLFAGGYGAMGVWGANAPTGSGFNGVYSIYAQGGAGDPSSTTSVGGWGGTFLGGAGGKDGGLGVWGVGGTGGVDGGDGVYGAGGTGTPASNDGYAGYFSGNVDITGTLTGGGQQVKIDHPFDPANKDLFHASVESSEMINIYTGNVTTDAQGDARVELPNWFEAVNADFRYQLTVIGQFAQAIVSGEVANHQFGIKTDKANVKVSWQITGVRQDAYAKAHPLVVEQEKDARERGHYIHPELYGASKRQSVDWARHSETLKSLQQVRAPQLAKSQKQGAPLK